jgi:hypothetical protein
MFYSLFTLTFFFANTHDPRYKEAQAEEEQLRIELEMEKELLAGKMAQDQAVARQKMEEEAAAKNKIIMELELEKKKIEEDLQSLKEQHESRRKRTSASNLEPMVAAASGGVRGVDGGDGGQGNSFANSKKHDWMHVSGLIAEANEISNRLKQNTVRSLHDHRMIALTILIRSHHDRVC